MLLYHATFCINSLAHVLGSKRYVTGDDSRNNWLLAFFTMGEGWHNNHHAYQSSVRQGFRWWEFDPTFYILKALSWLGIVWDLKTPPEQVLRNEQRLGARVIDRAAEQLAARFNSERIALAITRRCTGRSCPPCRRRLTRARDRASRGAGDLHLPHMPSREEILAQAKAMFARTRSLEEIVDRAHELCSAPSAHGCWRRGVGLAGASSDRCAGGPIRISNSQPVIPGRDAARARNPLIH